MASIYSGRGAFVGLGEETDYGDAVARTNFRPLISSNLLRTIEKVPRPSLRVGAAGAMRRSFYVQADNAGGAFVIEGDYNAAGMILKHVFGTSATSADTPSSGLHTHVYTFADDVPTGLTIENARGTGTSEVFEGCRISQCVFSVASGEVLTIEPTIIAETSAARGSSSTASFNAADRPILHHHAGDLSWNSATYKLIDMSLTINNALAVRQHLGSKVTAKPLRSDFQSVELTATIEVEDQLMADFISDAISDASITFSNGTESMTILVHNAYLSSVSDPVTDANVIRQSITLIGQSDGSDEGCKITTVNSTASATGN